jgi:hypothetical protein
MDAGHSDLINVQRHHEHSTGRSTASGNLTGYGKVPVRVHYWPYARGRLPLQVVINFRQLYPFWLSRLALSGKCGLCVQPQQ